MSEWQHLRNPRTLEHHRVLLIDHGRLSEERCNLDDSGEMEGESYEHAAQAVSDGESWCGNCCQDYATATTAPENES